MTSLDSFLRLATGSLTARCCWLMLLGWTATSIIGAATAPNQWCNRVLVGMEGGPTGAQVADGKPIDYLVCFNTRGSQPASVSWALGNRQRFPARVRRASGPGFHKGGWHWLVDVARSKPCITIRRMNGGSGSSWSRWSAGARA